MGERIDVDFGSQNTNAILHPSPSLLIVPLVSAGRPGIAYLMNMPSRSLQPGALNNVVIR